VQTLLDNDVPINERGELSPAMLVFSPEAKAKWVNFHNDVEADLRANGDLYDVRDVASKAAENAARLAALFHVIEKGPGGTIDADSLVNAARVVAWHLSEARRFFGELALPVELADAARLDSWLLVRCRETGQQSVSRRDVQRLGPNTLRRSRKLGSAIGYLIEADRVRMDEGGRRKRLRVNPALLEQTDGLA
jgi:putative DNA primase/helicase